LTNTEAVHTSRAEYAGTEYNNPSRLFSSFEKFIEVTDFEIRISPAVDCSQAGGQIAWMC
jgi:hypothetical protein